MVVNGIVESQVPVRTLSQRARDAALAFVNEAACGWGREELARWLVTTYAPAVHSIASPPSAARSREVTVDDASVARLVADARLRVARFLETLTAEDPADLARAAIEQGLVVPVRDPKGDIGYLPVSSPAMRLVPRLTALFVADYLSAPERYEEIAICQCCGMISFGSAEAHAAWCEPTPGSGTFRHSTFRVAEPFPLVVERVA